MTQTPSTEYTATELTAGVAHRFRVKAVNDFGETDYIKSEVVSTKC